MGGTQGQNSARFLFIIRAEAESLLNAMDIIDNRRLATYRFTTETTHVLVALNAQVAEILM